MKILIFTLMFGLALCMPRVTQDNHGEEEHYVAVPHSKVFNQAQNFKKIGAGGRGGGAGGSGRGGSTGSGSRSSGSIGTRSCSLDCMRQMKSFIENDPEFSSFIEEQSKPTRSNNRFNPQMLNKYCQKMNETIDCISPCTDTQVKDIASKALKLPRYMCAETKFTTYAPCYSRVEKTMEKVCHGPNKCGSKKAALERSMGAQPRSMADINSMLENTCDYMVCYADCDRQKVVQECGADANRVLEGLYKKSIEMMEDMFSTLSIQVEIPQICRRVGSGSGGDTDHDSDDDEDETGQETGRGGQGQGGRGGQGQGGRGGQGQGGRGGQGQGGRGGQGQGGRGGQGGGRGQGGQGGRGTSSSGAGGQRGRTTTETPDDYPEEQ